MSTHAHDRGPSDESATDQRASDDRYAALELAGDHTVIYDRSNHRAWLQSDAAVALDGML